jgi:hypothetical protein
MEILLYVIDNKLLEVYCQVIISIWVALCQVLWTAFPLAAWTVLLVCDMYRPRYISSNVNDAGCKIWNPFG